MGRGRGQEMERRRQGGPRGDWSNRGQIYIVTRAAVGDCAVSSGPVEWRVPWLVHLHKAYPATALPYPLLHLSILFKLSDCDGGLLGGQLPGTVPAQPTDQCFSNWTQVLANLLADSLFVYLFMLNCFFPALLHMFIVVKPN